MIKELIIASAFSISSLAAADRAPAQPLSVISPEADTLWLTDDVTGHLIAAAWAKRVRQPVIIFLSPTEFARLAKEPRYLDSDEKRRCMRWYD